jgi:hypothetical protein
MSVFCVAESPYRLPDLTNTTSKNKYLYQMVLHRPVELARLRGRFAKKEFRAADGSLPRHIGTDLSGKVSTFLSSYTSSN